MLSLDNQVLFQARTTQLDTPTLKHNDWQQNLPVNGDPSRMCPKCGKTFHRKQERDRHIRCYLPHSIYCPFTLCSWRGDRQGIFTAHWRKKHPAVPEPANTHIYDPSKLVNPILCGALTVEEAGSIASSLVERRAVELDKADVWENGWGRRRKKF
ncbi:hypothetical protein F5148DRAFT_113786 [Russula earlei]|uniref:Uncharacterized protein n=1 Tax=Russula earlei TaxID=71964 RepID=A0ACC0U727_9AGAM|nr:hypothetical protein F5148DRAFT_113786 [Russula earlei]